MNEQQKAQVIEQVRNANNVLVAVSANPTVDELAASIGLTLALNQMEKHATTVFSGVVPSTIEFLQPEKTIETTTDSLRDFIIALDKSKADKLRYKVEDDVVRIFITPYRTSISEQDLQFTQGDFNVDVVIALGVTRREDLDKAIIAHGGILHDATVISLTSGDAVSELGAMNWQEPQTSSLCEMVAAMTMQMQPDAIDGQMATALLTGIIAETDRFRNAKTSPQTLAIGSNLMAAGANQQLIAENLEQPQDLPMAAPAQETSIEEPEATVSDDGSLQINHDADEEPNDQIAGIQIDEHGNLDLEESSEQEVYEPEQPVAELPPVEEPVDSPDAAMMPEDLPSAPQVEVHSDRLPDQDMTQDSTEAAEQPSGVPAGDEHSDGEDEPTLKQPEVSKTPVLTHEKVIQPPEDTELKPQKSDKPFDLQEAMHEQGVPQQIQPSVPTDQQNATASEQASGGTPSSIPPPPPPPPVPPKDEPAKPDPMSVPTPDTDSLEDLERSVGSSHVQDTAGSSEIPKFPPPPPGVGDSDADTMAPPSAEKADSVVNDDALQQAQDAVSAAAASQPPKFPSPQEAVGSQAVDLETPTEEEPAHSKTDVKAPEPKPGTPPPVPPPMTPQFFDADGTNNNPFLNPSK